MLLPILAGCGKSGDDVPETEVPTEVPTEAPTEVPTEVPTEAPTEPETEAETKTPAEEALDRLNGTDWGGDEFGILYVKDIAGYEEENEGQQGGSVLSDAVYERNLQLEERCHLDLVTIPATLGEYTAKVLTEVHTNTGDFDLISAPLYSTLSMATSNYLYDYNELDIDYEQDWWDAGTLDFSLAGHTFFMNGSYGTVDKDVTFVMMFNKEMQEELQKYHRREDLYEVVESNRWTLHYFHSAIQEIGYDRDGDGKMTEQDVYGFATVQNGLESFFYGADLKYVNNGRALDEPELALSDEDQMEKAQSVLKLAQSIVHENTSSYRVNTFVAEPGQEMNSLNMFVEDRVLFYCEAATYLHRLNQSIGGGYGVLPMPKYSKDQANYTTWTHSIGSTLSMPATVVDEVRNKNMAAVLETYAVLSQMYVEPAYIESRIGRNGVCDENDVAMLEIIYDHRVYDMGEYAETFGFDSIFAECVYNNSSQFKQKYHGIGKSFVKRVYKLLDKLWDN